MGKNSLNDAELINCAWKHLGKLQFAREIHDELKEQLKQVRGSPRFGEPSFSLFLYNSSTRNLAPVWRLALEGAIAVIKERDLRERPFRYKEPTRPSKITRPAIEDIVRYFQAATEFERILYGADPWYRDHFAHVLRVWLLGLYVIFENKNKLIRPRVTGDSDLDVTLYDDAELYAAFTIAALTHDLGYPVQKVAKLNESLGRILDSTGGMDWQPIRVSFSLTRHEIAQQLLKLIASKPKFIEFHHEEELSLGRLKELIEKRMEDYKTECSSVAKLVSLHNEGGWGAEFRTQWKYYQKYSDSLEKMHHGLLSALLLQRKLLFFKEGEFALEEDYRFSLEEVRQFMIRREILRAIATHTCPDIYIINLLSVESLLFFCDEIQEWGRPFFSDIYSGKLDLTTAVELSKFSAKELEWEVTVGSLQLSSAAHWLLSSGRNLHRRLRSGPESSIRQIRVAFTLRWTTNGQKFVACCEFDTAGKKVDTDAFKFEVSLDAEKKLPQDIHRFIQDVNKGVDEKKVVSDIEECLAALNGSGG